MIDIPKKADVDGSGTLNCEEFVIVSVHLKKTGSDEHLAQAFSYFDKNNSGYIEFDELREALLDDKLGPANEKVIQDIIFDVDLDKVILKHIHLILLTSLRTFMIVLCNIIGTNLVCLFFFLDTSYFRII